MKNNLLDLGLKICESSTKMDIQDKQALIDLFKLENYKRWHQLLNINMEPLYSNRKAAEHC